MSKLTGKPVYYDKAKRALVETYNRRSPIGLVGTNINVETGQMDEHRQPCQSSEIDSYYEYLLKCCDPVRRYRLPDDVGRFDRKDHIRILPTRAKSMSKKNRTGTMIVGDLWYGHADMNTGKMDRDDDRRARRLFSGGARA